MKIAKFYQKTLFGIFAMMGVIVVAISVLYVSTVDRELTNNFVTDSKVIGSGIAGSNVDVIVNQNYSALQSIIDQFVDIGAVSYVYVVDETDTVIAHTFVPGIPKEIAAGLKDPREIYDRTLKGMGKFTEVTTEVLAGEAGRIHVGMDNGYIALQVQRAIGKQIYMLAIIFVCSILISYGLIYQVSRPLHDLAEYARHAMLGPDDAEPPPPERVERLMERVDEVGEISRLFRVLIDRKS